MSEKLPSVVKPASFPFAPGVKIVCEAEGLIAVYKPEGLRAHPNEPDVVDKGAMIAAPYDFKRECYSLPNKLNIYLLHRLDAPTSGLILLCTNRALTDKVRDLFEKHLVHKTYEALVFGNVGRGFQTWRDRLRTEKGATSGARTSTGAGILSVAKMRVLANGVASNGLPMSHLSLEPATGRTHQLRVQCASRQLPVVGDATYGNFAWNKRAAKELGIKRLCLHASAVKLELQYEGRKISFSAQCPAPEQFLSAISKK